jgi:hypothetical protein
MTPTPRSAAATRMAMVCAALAVTALSACGPKPVSDTKQPAQGQALAPGRIAPVPPPAEPPRKDYLKSQDADSRRAIDSMPAPSGSGQ